MAQLSELTNEQQLISRLFESAKQDLTKLEISKTERIRRLASDLDRYGVIPTDMICDFINSKLGDLPDVSRSFIIHSLDAKYKNQAKVFAVTKYKKAQLQQESLPQLFVPQSIDYENFDVRDCQIESWDYYPDCLKKRWVIQLLDDKKTLQCQIYSSA